MRVSSLIILTCIPCYLQASDWQVDRPGPRNLVTGVFGRAVAPSPSAWTTSDFVSQNSSLHTILSNHFHMLRRSLSSVMRHRPSPCLVSGRCCPQSSKGLVQRNFKDPKLSESYMQDHISVVPSLRTSLADGPRACVSVANRSWT